MVVSWKSEGGSRVICIRYEVSERSSLGCQGGIDVVEEV